MALRPPRKSEQSEEELVARLKRYDHDAVAEVVERHGDALYRYVYSLTGNHHLSEDIVGETYLRMIETIGSYTYRGIPFRAWLYRVAHNLAVSQMQRDGRTVTPSSDEVFGVAEDLPRVVEGRDEQAQVRAALAALTDEQQQVLLHRYVAEHSIGETARLLEKTEAAVKALQLRGLRALGRLLGYGHE